MPRSLVAFAPVEFGQLVTSAKPGLFSRLGGFEDGGRSARREAARSMQGSGSSPHWRLSQICARVGLWKLGHGLRKAIGGCFFRGRLLSGEGDQAGRYDDQPSPGLADEATT